MFPLGVALGLLSYAAVYYGRLIVRGYPAGLTFAGTQQDPTHGGTPAITFLDCLLPSRLAQLQAGIAAGPANPNGNPQLARVGQQGSSYTQIAGGSVNPRSGPPARSTAPSTRPIPGVPTIPASAYSNPQHLPVVAK